MSPDDALHIAQMLDEVQKGRFAPPLFDKDGGLTNVGTIWIDLLEEEPDAAMATHAVAALYTANPPTTDGVPRPITPADFRGAMRNERAKVTALPSQEESFERELEPWVKGKAIALLEGDVRAWPEQKPGYDALQKENPFTRTYVWPEQEMITDEARAKYMERGKSLSSAQAAAIIKGGING